MATEGLETLLGTKFQVLFPHLDERQRRLLAAAEARSLGRGGIRLVARAAGMREGTVSRGVAELESGANPLGRVRRPGGGRKRLTDLDPGLRPALLALVKPDERNDPASPLRWTAKSLRVLAGELTRAGHRIGADTVADLLREEGFSLQGSAGAIDGKQRADRDAQFRYIYEQVRDHQSAGEPVVSVDARKRELVGSYRSGGRPWHPAYEPVVVSDHDDSPGEIPYGSYELDSNARWVNVGTDDDTAAFGVESIRRWWKGAGAGGYPHARQLLIIAGAGGSHAYRTRLWKAALGEETGLDITVCHFPPGTSKWSKIEHQLSAHITMNWGRRPLTSHEVIVQSIAATTNPLPASYRAPSGDQRARRGGAEGICESAAGFRMCRPLPVASRRIWADIIALSPVSWSGSRFSHTTTAKAEQLSRAKRSTAGSDWPSRNRIARPVAAKQLRLATSAIQNPFPNGWIS